MEIRRIEEEVKDAYLDYAMSVIVGRALPDVRDGLKPVQRRILYAMKDMGLTHNKPFKKCARIVGEVLGKYHPHGDAPVYDALVRMAQPFVMRYPLIQPQGNFGSIDGDPPAAMRYTEARLSPIAEEMLEDLDKECVPFQPNFDGSLKEPLFLPSKFPNLLCNGSSGIAVGMSTNIPPHNLTEVVDGLLALMNGRDPMEHIQGPDFPTGGIVIGDIKQIYSQGRGLLRIRARAKFEKNKIIIYEIPYHVNKASLVREIAELIKNKRLNASEVRDRSDREGIRIEVIPKRGFEPNRLFNAICKKTSAEITYRVNLLVLSDGQPIHMSFTQMLEAFLEHRRETVRKRTEYLLKQYLKRTEILEGFIEVTRRTDEIIAMIKSSENKAAARERLISAGFTERQAEAILEMKLSSLTKLESNRMQEELRDLRQKIERCRAILNSKEELDAVIKEELLYLKEKYGDERRSLIAGHVDEIKERTVLVLGEYFIEATLPEVQAMRKIRALITTPEALIFGKRRLWRMDTAVLHGKRPSDFEDFLKVLPYFPEGVLLFEDGRVKKMSFNIAKRSTGIKLPSELADAALVSSEYLLISKTDHGYVLTDEELRAMGRASQGVMGIRDGGKYILPKAPWVILFGEGRVLKLPWSEFPKLKRPAKGVKMAPFAIKRAFSAGDESTIYVLEPTPKRIKVKDIPAANHRTNRGEKVRWRDIVII